MTPPLILGEAPSRAGDRYHAFPCSGAIGKRLCEFAGIEPDVEGSAYGKYYWPLRDRFDCLNVIERHADAYPWSVVRARERWTRYLLTRPAAEQRELLTVVALGRRAADAMGYHGDWFKWLEVGLLRVAVIPHPSGKNLIYNDPSARERAGQTLREAMR